MACGCGKTKFTPPSAAQKAAADAAAKDAAGNVLNASALRGRRAPGYTWNGPDPEPADVNA